jgi:chloramphenicol O-acetyltransferase type B
LVANLVFNIHWNRIKSRLRGEKPLQDWVRQQKKFKARYPKITLGHGSYGMPIVHEFGEGTTLSIGSYTSIASNVNIFLGGNHRTDWVSQYPFPAFMKEAEHISDYHASHGDVMIGSDVWLCSNCTILSGVTIGHGAVIGSGAVISHHVEPYAVMVGNPAKLVRWRFDETTRSELLKSAWWEWPETEIKQVVNLLCSNKLSEFFIYASNRD